MTFGDDTLQTLLEPGDQVAGNSDSKVVEHCERISIQVAVCLGVTQCITQVGGGRRGRS